jgi:hypothetical protein
MTLGARLRQRLGSLSSGRLKLAALAVLLLYAIIMLWPYLAATLVRGSAVTAWMNLATAPIPGRAPVQLPLVGSQVGADGVSSIRAWCHAPRRRWRRPRRAAARPEAISRACSRSTATGASS